VHREAVHRQEGAAEAFGAAWLEAYGMDAVDATITDVMGTFQIGA